MAQSGDLAAREEAVLANQGLVLMCAKQDLHKARDTGYTLEDLVQFGTIGLIKAIDRFDAEQGAQFSTYAVPTIKGEIARAIRDHGFILRSPRTVYDSMSRVVEATSRLAGQNGRNPSVSEIAIVAQLNEGKVAELQQYLRNGVTLRSLDAPNEKHDNSEPYLADRVFDPEEPDPTARKAEGNLLKDMIVKAVADGAIEQRQAEVLFCMYFSGDEVKTQELVGEMMGYSQVHVSRLRQQALGALKEYFLNDN